MNLLRRLYSFQQENTVLNYAVFILFLLIVTTLSLKPEVNTGSVPYNDKVAHFLTYAILTLLAARVSPTYRRFTIYAVLVFFYSGVIEILQSYTGRMMSSLDLLANGAGVMAMFIMLCPIAFPTRS